MYNIVISRSSQCDEHHTTQLAWAVGSIMVPTTLFLILQWQRGRDLDLKNGLWWILYLGGLIVILCLTDKDGRYPMNIREQMILSALFALTIFPIAVASRLKMISKMELEAMAV